MSSKLRRFKILWILVTLTSLAMVFWQDFDTSAPSEKPSFLKFLDRHWASAKQKMQRQWQSSRYQQSHSIQILELRYPHQSHFWFDDAKRRKLADFLASYEGPIILHLDPEQVRKDPYLRDLLQQKNLIRGFDIEYGQMASLEIESWLARDIKQPSLAAFYRNARQRPTDPDYYKEGYHYGHLSYVQDASAQFVHSYPLSLQGSRFFLPSISLAALQSLDHCPEFEMPSKNNIRCPKQDIAWETSLQLFFYREPAPTFQTIEKITETSRVLIVDIHDPTSTFSTLSGDRMTWSQLVATSIGNLLKGHAPWRNSYVRLYEVFIFVFLAAVLVSTSLRKRLYVSVMASIACLLGFLALDLIVSLVWNPRTEIVEEFLALVLISLASVSTRAIVDYEERSLIERALSGYVSPDRLRRLLSGKEQLELGGRTRQMSTLLIDIAGFAKISESLSPQEVFRFIQQFFSIVDNTIFEYRGVIDKKTGDGLLAFFGDEEGEDQPEKAAQEAVQAALQIQKRLLHNYRSFGLSSPIQCRIGVNSGTLIIGNAGSKQHFDYTVFGECVNFTQRLEAACPPGEVIIGETTATLLHSQYQLEEIWITIKHQQKPVRAYKVYCAQ